MRFGYRARHLCQSATFHLNSAPLLRAALAPRAFAVTEPGSFGCVLKYW